MPPTAELPASGGLAIDRNRLARKEPPALAGSSMVATMNMGIVEENTPGASSTGWERGRRRTRQDQISLGARGPAKLRILRSAPNEENLFLLPDRLSSERALSKLRSSRLT
jgi:hypothetical protein